LDEWESDLAEYLEGLRWHIVEVFSEAVMGDQKRISVLFVKSLHERNDSRYMGIVALGIMQICQMI